MTNPQLVLNMLAEASATEISKQKEPQTFEENKTVVQQGGQVANAARKQLEETTGKKVVTSKNAKGLKNKPRQSEKYSNNRLINKHDSKVSSA